MFMNGTSRKVACGLTHRERATRPAQESLYITPEGSPPGIASSTLNKEPILKEEKN